VIKYDIVIEEIALFRRFAIHETIFNGGLKLVVQLAQLKMTKNARKFKCQKVGTESREGSTTIAPRNKPPGICSSVKSP
jgi:hypothetical protein